MKSDACFELGKIIKPHGVKGEVSVTLVADNAASFNKIRDVFIEINTKLIPFVIEKITIHQNRAIIKFEDLNSEAETEQLIQQKIFLPLTMLPKLKEDQFYYHEVIGYSVMDEALGALGVVTEIYEMPGQDLIAMNYQNQEVLIPMDGAIVLSANHEHRIIHVSLPAGLLELYINAENEQNQEHEN